MSCNAQTASVATPSTVNVRGGPGSTSTAAGGVQAGVPNPLRGHPKYQKVKDLSSGSFGFVQLAHNIQSEPPDVIAIKFIERGERVNRYVEAEILNHRMLRHPHVIEFKEVFLTPEHICIAMEYASGGNLLGYVQHATQLKEPAARWFFQQLIIGLDYCHRRGVVNRDIKLENTLLQMVPGLPLPLIKICDFGYSKAHFMSAPKSKVGTLAYMAPEVIKTTGNYDGKLADIWSCGVMLYVMLFGQYPFEQPRTETAAAAAVTAAAAPAKGTNGGQRRIQTMMTRILNMQWAIPRNVEISKECVELLSRMLVADPNERITMAQIQSSPWFTLNLPTNALQMNDDFLEHTDYTGVQTVEDIQAILQTAQTPGPGRYNFNTEEEENYEEGLIDDAIQDDLVAHNSSFDLSRMPAAQARAAASAAASMAVHHSLLHHQQQQRRAAVASQPSVPHHDAPSTSVPLPATHPSMPLLTNSSKTPVPSVQQQPSQLVLQQPSNSLTAEAINTLAAERSPVT